MSRLIDANEVVKAILEERDKIPRTITTAPYELGAEKPYHAGDQMRGGIRKALRCIEQAPTVAAVHVVRCEKCVLHGNCVTEDAFVLSGIENPFCCAGKRKEGAYNEP